MYHLVALGEKKTILSIKFTGQKRTYKTMYSKKYFHPVALGEK